MATTKKTTKATEPKEVKKVVKKAPKASGDKVTNKSNKHYATGRRKSATCRLWLAPGNGRVTVNGLGLAEYFKRPTLSMLVEQPLVALNLLGQIDIFCTVKGSGLTGQAGAIRHALSRALDKLDESNHTVLSRGGFLTRDPRKKERKKFGLHAARRAHQFSKR